MKLERAKAIYLEGEASVVASLRAADKRANMLLRENRELRHKIAALSKNSSNSSKPPSSDDIVKSKSKDKGKGGKNESNGKIGGQPGHKGHKRKPWPSGMIDRSHQYESSRCPHCRSPEIQLLEDQPPRVIQQAEIKETIVREEHLAHAYWCENCEKHHHAEFPPATLKEGLFKSRLTTLVAYMKNVCHASFSTIRKYIRDVLGETVARGYLAKIIQKVSRALERPYEELLKRIPLETVLNVDETGHKNNGDRFWTWVFRAELYVLFRVDKSRGSNVLIDVLGKEFKGVLGCDYFSAYRKFMKDFNVSVQFCLAHLIRDIKYLKTLPENSAKAYGERLLQAVKDMFGIIHRREEMSPKDFRTGLKRAKKEIARIAVEGDRPDEKGWEAVPEVVNMADRFRTHGDAYFEFITTPQADPTNNIAEQAVRFIVIDRLVTQGTRSEKGQRASERLWTVIGTCAIQDRSAFDFILRAVRAYFQETEPPSLILEPP